MHSDYYIIVHTSAYPFLVLSYFLKVIIWIIRLHFIDQLSKLNELLLVLFIYLYVIILKNYSIVLVLYILIQFILLFFNINYIISFIKNLNLYIIIIIIIIITSISISQFEKTWSLTPTSRVKIANREH